MPDSIDLREHFSVWGRCGGSSFWKEMNKPPYQHVYVNVVDGIVIIARGERSIPWPPKEDFPAYTVFVYDASDLTHEDIMPAFPADYPWVKRVMMDFFTGLMLIRLGLTKETPLSFFLKYYMDQTKKYIETGEGHSEKTGKDELLEAMKRLIGTLGRKALKVEKTILRDELPEFLEAYGILEC